MKSVVGYQQECLEKFSEYPEGISGRVFRMHEERTLTTSGEIYTGTLKSLQTSERISSLEKLLEEFLFNSCWKNPCRDY